MRQANEMFAEGSYLRSDETKTYEQMFDNQLSLSLTRGRGISLANTIVEQLQAGKKVPEKPSENGIPLAHSFPIDMAPKVNKPIKIELQEQPLASLPLGPIPLKTAEIKTTERTSSFFPLETNTQEKTLASTTTEALVDANVTAKNSVKPVTQILFIPTTPDEFIQWVYPAAVEVAKELGVSPKVLVAQSALETGWGQKPILTAEGKNSHNLFGIKADQRWSGEKATVGTLEYRSGIAKKEQASFRVYESIKDSLKDYAQFLKQSPRYQHALEKAGDPSEFTHSLMDAGYATDPKYAEKIMGIFDGKLLNRVIEGIK